MHFTVEPVFWSLFPQARIGVVVARGLDNRRAADTSAALQDEAARNAVARLGNAGEIAAHPAVAPWRAAYRAFGVKPSKFRSSIENLLRAAASGRLGSVNPLVDLYNTISLTHLLPCGGEDIARLAGDLHLTRAAGDEEFVPLGSTQPQPPQPGEVIYRDDAGVICRAWNWREAERTKLTAATTDAFLCIEAVPPITEAAHRDACHALAALVTAHLGGTATVTIVTMPGPEMVI